jgi:hypothetical protein
MIAAPPFPVRAPVRRAALFLGAMALLAAGCAHTPASPLAAAAPPNPEGARAAVGDLSYRAAVRAIDRRDYGQALDLLQRARTRAPGDARVLNAFGVVYDKLGRFDLSARYYALAEAADPASPIVANNIAYSQALQFAAASPVPAAPIAPAGRPPIALASGRAWPSPAKAQAPAAMPARQPVVPAASAAARPPAAAPLIPVERTGGPVIMAASVSSPAAPSPSRAAAPRPALASALPAAPVRLIASDGGPVLLIDASGAQRGDGAEPIRRALLRKGWWAHRRAERQARREVRTTIVYARANVATAKALWRSLPGRVALVACQDNCRGVRLIVGADAAAMRFAPRTRRSS